jgi:pimeloyl-ACP methyl ester carboxylesterase
MDGLARPVMLALASLLLAASATAEPRLERERCPFKPPRGDRVECFVLIVPENRALPEGREVRLKVAILKAKRPAVADPVIYLPGGPGDAPLVASTAGADALQEADWWNETAMLRRRRDVIIMSQRGGGSSSPNLDCFDPRLSEPAKARRRAVTDAQERDILQRCRAALERRKVDLAMYATPALADDVADLAQVFSLSRINLYGVSYGTRWALEVIRRHPELVRSAVLDGAYPPQVNGEQNEAELVRRAFEQLYADCAADSVCRIRHPELRSRLEALIEATDRKPLDLAIVVDSAPQSVRLDGAKLLLVLLHMMREGEAAMIPEAAAEAARGELRLLRMFAEDLEANEGGLLEQSAQQFDGLFNSIECRETWAVVDQAERRRVIENAGVYGLTARQSKSPAFCPVWRVPAAPASERQPVKGSTPVLVLSGAYDWLTPPAWGRETVRHLANSRHVVFRAQGHGVVIQDPCGGRLRDDFIEDPDPKRAPVCRGEGGPNFTAASERVRALP